MPPVNGTSGADSFTAPIGSSAFNGLGGTDTIIFNFKLTDATFTFSGNQVTVHTATSDTVLTGFEIYQFTDGTVNDMDSSPLVDDLYYYANYHDVWNAHIDADTHYNTVGWHEGRNPNAFFNTKLYLQIYPSVAASGVNPLVQFDQTGWKQGALPSLNFDVQQYLTNYPDVVAKGLDPLAHFLEDGAEEGRTNFVPLTYTAPNGFDYVYYLQHNPDVAAAGIDPFQHFETVGWKEGRNPNAYFDVAGYLATYADVKAAGVNPLDQFHNVGWTEGRLPSPLFDPQAYLAHYADVAAAHVDPLEHFLKYGIYEGRSTFASAVVDKDATANFVIEGAATSTKVGLTAAWGSWTSPNVFFSISADSSGGGFTIDPLTGVVSVANGNLIDFEATASHSYTITVVAHDGALTNSQDFTINVGDAAPALPTGAPPIGSVNELAANGTSVGITFQATDPNGPAATYSLTDNAGGRFAIDPTTGVVTVANGAAIDYETAPSHAYSIIAKATVGALSVSETLTINVNDVNDNAPVFTSSATPSVAENTTAVVDLATTDADTVGTNPPTFTITGGADSALFQITGGNHLSFIAPRDFETQAHSYAVQVTADDGANQTVQNITVTLADVNDNAPVFTSSATASVAENTTAVLSLATTDADTVGTNPPTFTITGGADQGLFTITGGNQLAFIAPRDFETQAHSYAVQVTANDGANQTVQNITVTLTDANDNAPVFTSSATPSVTENTTAVVDLTTTDADTVGTNPPTFSITGGADSALFQITGGNHLEFITPPDFETQAHSYDVQVTANDGTNNTVQNITVTLTDTNDNAPVFTSSATPSVAEDTTAVVSLTTTDADTVGTNPPTFTITGGADQGLFTITGGNQLAFIAPRDFETQAHSYAVQVTANDGVNNTVQNITVTLTDANDNAPVFTSSATPSVAENTTAVVDLTTTDADTVGTNPPTFSITGGADSALFQITGGNHLEFISAPDFETQAHSYDVQVTANDGTNNTVQNLTVALTDTNDNSPIFQSGTTGSEFENAPTSTVAYDADATDADLTPAFSTITYSLSAGGDNDLFNINSSTGEVTFKVSPDFEAPQDAGGNNVYDIVVHANDGLHDVTQNVAITVNDVNDPPTLTATGTNPTYTPGVDLFSGVSASTIESGQFIDQLVFTVSNVNDTDETISIDGSAVALIDGTHVASTAIDGMDVTVAVVGTTATVTISKSGGVDASIAAAIVDGLTYTDASVSNGQAARTVTITSLHDTGGNANGGNPTGTPNVTSTVLFNQPPVIDAPANADTFATSIAENTTAVTTVHATDPDNQPNPTVTYSIVAGFEDAAKFNIDPNSGVLTFISAPDFENPTDTATDGSNTYIVKVRAFDGASFDEQTITVTVNNVNEAPTAHPDTASVTEAGGLNNATAGTDITSGFNVITGTGIGSVADTDPDAGTTLTVVGAAAGTQAGPLNTGVNIGQHGAGALNYGTFTVQADGSYTYLVNQTNTAVEGLRQFSDTLTDTFSYTISDGGLTSTSTVTVTIHGQDDTPVAHADNPSVTEAGGISNGTAGTDITGFTANVLTGNGAGNVADTDVDSGDTMTVVGVLDGDHSGTFVSGNIGPGISANAPNDYGTLTMHSDGSYNFVVNQSNATVEALNVGQHVDAVFTYTMQDAAGQKSTALLTVTVNGADDAPVGVADSYTALESTAAQAVSLTPNAASGVLGNDTDVDTAHGSLTAVLQSGPSHAASFALNSDGSFSYTPTNGYLGADSFTYKASDGTLQSATTTVAIDVQPHVAFIDNSSVSAIQDGSQANPFHSIAAFNAANTAANHFDIVYLEKGTGTYTEADGIHLTNGQTLLGQGVDLTYTKTLGGTVTLLDADNSSGSIPTINVTTAGNNAVYLAQNNTISGFTIGNTSGAGAGVVDNGGTVGTLLISNMSINDTTGQAMKIDNGGTLAIDTTHGGDTTKSFSSVTSTSSNGEGITLGGTGGGNTLGGTLKIGTTSVTDASGNAIHVLNTASGASFDFGGTTVNDTAVGGHTGNGINLATGIGATNSFSFGSLSVKTDGGTALTENGGTLSVGGTTNTIDAHGGAALDISNANITGGATFSSVTQVSANAGTNTGINLSNLTSGSSVTFSGTTSIDTHLGTGAAVNLTNNTGSSFTFSGGGTGLDISTSSGIGFNATGGGTVTVQGTGNTINSTSGTALDIANTTIGSNNVTFQSISSGSGSNSSATGIILDTTGSSGGLHVTGTGTTAGSGGTIQHKTGADGSTSQGNGIYLNNTSNVQLANMQLNDFQNYGIVGTNVTNFTLAGTTVNGTNGTSVSGIGEGDAYFTGLSGSASVTNSTFTGAAYDAFHVFNDGAQTLNRLTITGSTFATNPAAGNASNDAIGLQATGGTFNVTVQNSTVNSARSDMFQLNLLGVVSSDLVLTGNTMHNTNGNIVSGGGGITVGGGGVSNNITLTYDISNNSISGAAGADIAVSKGTGVGASFTGTISGNTIGTQGVAGSGSTGGEGIFVKLDGAGTSTTTITNNHISGVDAARGAIDLLNQNGGGGKMVATITGNTIDTLDQANSFAGMYLQTGSGSTDNNISNLTVNGNTIDIGPNSAGNIAAGIFLEQEGHGKVGILGSPPYNGGTGTYDFTAVQNYVAAHNTITAPNGSPVAAIGNPGQPAGFGYFGTAQLMAAAGGIESASNTLGETHLTQAELDAVVQAAIANWAAAGASSDQIAALQGTIYTVADLPANTLGAQAPGLVLISANAAGYGWFIDPSPFDNAEFAHAANASGTDLFTDSTQAAAGHMDLLTAVTHEMGHVLGLPDDAATSVNDVMFDSLVTGERRLPTSVDVAAATAAEQGAASDGAAMDSVPPPTVTTPAADTVAPGQTVSGTSGADSFKVDPSVVANTASQPIATVVGYSAAQGDVFDFSTVAQNSHSDALSMALTLGDFRVVEDGGNTFATLQLHYGTGDNWVSIAHLDGVHAGDAVTTMVLAGTSTHIAEINASWHV